MTDVNKILSAATELLADSQPAHSDFQLRHFVLGTQAYTPYTEYMQALREIGGRIAACLGHAETVETVEAADDGSPKRHFNAVLARRAHDEAHRELRVLYDRAAELKEQIGPLDDEKRQQLEHDSWYIRLRSLAAIEYLTERRLKAPTLEAILATREVFDGKLVDAIANPLELVQVFLEENQVPGLPMVSQKHPAKELTNE